MTTFQIDEPITLNTWDDIINRPLYTSSVKAKKHHYSSIIAAYDFQNEGTPCGVSDCHKPHKRGFLVTTSQDMETNICESCGKRFFNISYEKQVKYFISNDKVRSQKIQLNKILDQDNTKKRINQLKESPKGANWLYQVQTSFSNHYPLELITALKELAKHSNQTDIPEFFAKYEADSSQIEAIKQIKGLDIFLFDIRDELIIKILKPLLELDKIVNEPELKSSLTKYCTWSEGLEEQFELVENLLSEGQAFFNKWNLENIKSIPLPVSSARVVRNSSWNITKASKK